MTPRIYFLVTASLLAVVALAHAARIALQLTIQIDTWNAPMWLSGAGLVVAGALSAIGFQLAREDKGSRAE